MDKGQILNQKLNYKILRPDTAHREGVTLIVVAHVTIIEVHVPRVVAIALSRRPVIARAGRRRRTTFRVPAGAV